MNINDNSNERVYDMLDEASDFEKNIEDQILNTPWF